MMSSSPTSTGQFTAPASRRSTSLLGGAAGLLGLSLIFHLCYIGSIFDIYFKSTVTRGVVQRYGVSREGSESAAGAGELEGLAKRVVLLVGDGLRADKLFQTYPDPPFSFSEALPAALRGAEHAKIDIGRTTPASFIRNLIQSGKAEWGVSHTRVPTESRPGHVALIGGMYEDVSAVTRGWTANPVAFDSVFNQSTHTFSFGSPDILPMFRDGASDPSRVDAWSYGEEYEDFSTDAVHLDLWCLEQLKTLLRNSTSDSELARTLHQPGTIFFLHLLGLDTTGHSYRPHGPEYHRNIRVVDYVVEQTTRVLSEFYGDDDTAYVFTADHGMSSKGNHGDGEPDNTRTPLVVWGAGVGGTGGGTAHNEYSKRWGLSGVRRDVEQADVAVLMSVLGGLPIPANSAGRVPLDYLDASASFKARAAFANAQQILAEFEVKSYDKQRHALSFRPFPELSDSKSPATRKATVKALIAAGLYEEAQKRSVELVDIGLRGLRYFQTYDWFILRSVVTLGYLGFMAYSITFLLRQHVYAHLSPPRDSSSIVKGAGMVVFLALSIRFLLEKAPVSYHLYAVFPCFFWTSVLRDAHVWRQVWIDVRPNSPSSIVSATVAIVAALQMMVWGYARRELFAAVLVVMGLGWPAFGMDVAFVYAQGGLLAAWAASCLSLAIFPLLPVEKGESTAIILAGGVTSANLALLAIRSLETDNAIKKIRKVGAKQGSLTLSGARRSIQYQILLTVACMIVTASSARSLQLKQGLPAINQSLGWIIIIQSIVVPFVHGRPAAQPYMERLFVILFTFAPAFIILSLSYEALFLAALCVTLVIWQKIEYAVASHSKEDTSTVRASHVRIALFFLAFVHISFFGVGNVASISSFYLEPVYRLIPVFRPFPMAALLLFKLLTPFVALSLVTTILNHRLKLPPFSLFIIASILSDYLALNFFFLVTDEGSWLEIGSSITNFAICSLLGIFNTALYLGGEVAMAKSAFS